MTVFYNEIDPFAAEWLRELIKAGMIAPGIVDERDIRDIPPDDLAGFDQCHFFAGIGVWSFALRAAGWPDDRPAWTGSCPCQPFSAAGKGAGFADERHLWPSWHWLIEQCRPPVVFGEQVASKDAEPWLDLVQADLEALGYALGAVPFPSAGIGAPHIRDRLYWVADADDARPQGRGERGHRAVEWPAGAGGVAGGLADADVRRHREIDRAFDAGERSGLELSCGERRERGQATAPGYVADGSAPQRTQDQHGGGVTGTFGLHQHDPGPTNGVWRDADWLFCRDGKWRPVEPGTFPLAHGAPARVGRLRGYGNAINAEAARVWVESYLEAVA